MACSIYAFDAYGTLFDVHAAVRRHAAALGPEAAQISALWRAKQLEYSWVRTLAGRYQDFWSLTEQALDYALAFTTSPIPRCAPPCLKLTAISIAIRKSRADQGSQAAGQAARDPVQRHARMLASAVKAAGLDGCFDAVLSVDDARAYKTDQRVYDIVTTHFRVYPEAVSFQSSNRWDIAGASVFG
jgi:2-haloacid dehalogenase